MFETAELVLHIQEHLEFQSFTRLFWHAMLWLLRTLQPVTGTVCGGVRCRDCGVRRLLRSGLPESAGCERVQPH